MTVVKRKQATTTLNPFTATVTWWMFGHACGQPCSLYTDSQQCRLRFAAGHEGSLTVYGDVYLRPQPVGTSNSTSQQRRKLQQSGMPLHQNYGPVLDLQRGTEAAALSTSHKSHLHHAIFTNTATLLMHTCVDCALIYAGRWHLLLCCLTQA